MRWVDTMALHVTVLVTAHILDSRQTDTLPIGLAIAGRSLKASERLFGTLSQYLNLNYLRAYAISASLL